jgi:hypothetical protein
MYGPTDPRTGFAKDVTPDPPRFPVTCASSDELAARQTARCMQRLRDGQIRGRDDVTAEEIRLGLLKAFGAR